jgi:hypothetical protein
MIKQIGCAILFIAIAGSAAAGDKDKKCKKDCAPATPTPWVKAPEIDAASATAALTLMAGGLAVLLGRRKKELKA